MRAFRRRLAVLGIILPIVAVAAAQTQATTAVRLTWSGPVALSGLQGQPISALACPSLSRCTAVDQDQEVTFDPLTGAVSAPLELFAAQAEASISGLACPALTRCTAVRWGQEVTFDPRLTVVMKPVTIDPNADENFGDVACPSATLCVGGDGGGSEVAFDPATGRLVRPATSVADIPLDATACPALDRCISIDSGADIVTFDPGSGHVLTESEVDPPMESHSEQEGSDSSPAALACPSAGLCVTVDPLGNAASFNPTSQRAGKVVSIDRGNWLTAVACPSIADCVAVDSRGRAYLGDPANEKWLPETVTRAKTLIAVACASSRECVAVDAAGDAFLGRRG
ncbi:MAG: hypothetical protein ACLP0J_22000 [Solirubrobacteraceae bacterium]